MEWVDVPSGLHDTRVFLKPNMTWTDPTPGVTTTPAMLEALVAYLCNLTHHIVIVESNGGQNCFQTEEAFSQHGVYEIAKRYGVQVVNLSRLPSETVETEVAGKRIAVRLPSMLLHDVDVFITVPVPKVHAMTGVSMAFKNQWGCQPETMRVRYHPQFVQRIVAINKLLKPRLAVFDGTYFLDETGPMIGEAVPMNLLIVSDDIGAGSMACCQIMGLDYRKIKHFREAQREGMFPNSPAEVQFNVRPEEFATRQFRLKRVPMNYVQLAAFNNRLLNRLLYDSTFADPLHGFVYFLRQNSIVRRLLYGRFGPGEAIRRSAY
jgi:uncharacterized protein (DUF362 family)